MNRRFIWPIVFSLCACGPIVEVDEKQLAEPAQSMVLTGRVVDQADLLTDEAEQELTGMLENLERSSGPQFVIATTTSLNGQAIADYSVDLARAWGIGDKSRNDGVLLLVAPNERKVRIEVGYGLEGTLNDRFCADVIRDNILPGFTKGNMEEGITNGATRLIEKMQRVSTLPANDNAPETGAKNRKAS